MMSVWREVGIQIRGEKLVELVKRNPGKSDRQLAKIAGYTTTSNTGQQRVKMLAFQNAFLSANKDPFKAGKAEVSGARGGRKATYHIQVQQNGNLLIGNTYTRQMSLIPGTEFGIQIGRKYIKLIQVDNYLQSPYGGGKASYRIQVQQNGNLLIGAAYTRQMGLIPGTEFEIQIGRKHIKLVQVESSLEPEIQELLFKKEVDKFSDQELRDLINYSAPPNLDEKFHELLDLKRARALNSEEKYVLNRMMDLYDIGMRKKSQAIAELYKRGMTL
jgi:AbrB-like transcriptional regulator